MTTSSPATEAATAKHVRVTEHALVVELRDGRSVSVPIKWYPRLAEGRPTERRRWELIGPGIGIHWPDLDEDIPVEGVLLGLPSRESASSLARWRATRRRPANEWSRRWRDDEAAAAEAARHTVEEPPVRPGLLREPVVRMGGRVSQADSLRSRNADGAIHRLDFRPRVLVARITTGGSEPCDGCRWD